ncbi:hypothetical protein IAE51_11370 [Lactococcus sp. S64]|uniref:hypothetical protein n=1 Tax=Lactococcus sp. S64 TaxID=2767459 RepID=UPI0019057989|nr:hypothetical protein [Lactococcus sp. S64]MBK0084490.1 hypothetical protein [Lactococcus sp. S64]
MERVVDSEFIYKILVIIDIWEEEEGVNITFETEDDNGLSAKEYYKLVFTHVISIEKSIMDINRLRFSKLTVEKELKSNICLIEGSDRIKSLDEYFIDIYKPNNLKHYLIVDSSDTVLDVLAYEQPVVKKIDKPESIKILKKEVEHLAWWNNNENISVIEKELEELRDYKEKRENEDKKSKKDEILANSFGF